MIVVSEALRGRLVAEATSLALCWRIERRDGVALGFTGHDRDLVFDGMIHRAAPGVMSSAISLSDGLEAETMEVTGALSAAGLDERALAEGRYDGAGLWLFMVDWQQPELGRLMLARGRLGRVERREGRFTAELRGPADALGRPALELISPECRALLGDRRCRVDLARHRREARVTAVADALTVMTDAPAAAADSHAYGRLRLLDGAGAGLSLAIRGGDGGTIVLRSPPPVAIAIGARVELTEGCDKRLATCRDRFGNAANFRGEPHVPGTDLLARYGGV